MSDYEQTILSAQVPTHLRNDLHRLARDHDRSMSAEIRAALRLHLHLAGEQGGVSSSQLPAVPVERSGPEENAPAVEPLQLAGRT